MSHWSNARAVQKSQKTTLFTKRQLLSEHSYRIRNWARHAFSLALMNGSLFLRDAFAFAATKEQYDAKELYGRILQRETDVIDFRYEWLFRLGRLVALQNLDDSDAELALFCLEESTYNLRLRSHRIESLRLQVELLAETGRFKKALRVLSEAHALYGERYDYLSVDLNNPFMNAAGKAVPQWLYEFNRPFRNKGLAEIILSESSDRSPFDRLHALPNFGPMPDGPLISVIMTSYAPDERAFELAARSILNQSWRNLELVVVDDATPGGAPRVLEDLVRDDARVKIIELEENRGTYHARNVGLKAATGSYVTGQDSDDWSHPDRLYRQVKTLQNNDDLVGVVTKAMRSDDNLFRILRGIEPERLCEVSLMFPAETGRSVGGYLESRKGADSEFRLRLELFSGKYVTLVDEPLYLTRLSSGSLSRTDFKRGWAHPNRRAFSNLIKHWHRTARPSDLVLRDQQLGTTAIPPKFRSRVANTRSFEYVFLFDWRFDDAETRSALAEVEALGQAGKSVGILQSSGLFSGVGHVARLASIVQERINREEISLIIPDENADIKNLIVRRAELLQFSPAGMFQGTVERLFIIADQPPSAWDGSSPIYHPEQCSDYALNEFGSKPIWLAQDPAILRYLISYAGEVEVWRGLLPHVLPLIKQNNYVIPQRPNRRRVVVGRPAKNIEALWPKDIDTTDALWPAAEDAQVEVRIFGEAECYLQKFNRDFYPNNWVSFRQDDISPEAFYSSIDYFVYYPEENWPQELSLEALMAYSNGCRVILPRQFENMHGVRAFYSEAKNVKQMIHDLPDPGDLLQDRAEPLNDAAFVLDRSRNTYVQAIESLTQEDEGTGTKIE